MISKAELMRLSAVLGIPVHILEKDYVLGWILAALSEQPPSADLRFKGGTCIKKIYEPDHRFSEDLDFTCLRRLTVDEIRDLVELSAHWIREHSGLDIALRRPQDLQPRGSGGFRARLGYAGPLDYPGGIKLHIDFTWQELFVDAPGAHLEIRHAYSDVGFIRGRRVWCYTLEEITAEKMRALIERTQPRDLYDVWQLLTRMNDRIETNRVRGIFLAKCRHHEVDPVLLCDRLSDKHVPVDRWEDLLQDLVPGLPPLTQVLVEVQDELGRLFGVEAFGPGLREVIAEAAASGGWPAEGS